MGDRDSSATRVTPVFDELVARDRTGAEWITPLLALACLEHGRIAPRPSSPLEECRWGSDEKGLMPPRVLLQWLACCCSRPSDGVALSASVTTREKRDALLRRDPLVVGEALALLSRARLPTRAWYVLEGPTYPDVYLQTADAIVVIEGKRTEIGPTTNTTWMPGRHQMLRHLDCAWEIRGGRNVFGFFIVEGAGGPENSEVPENWRDATMQTVSSEPLSSSLPHRLREERAEIAKCFLGVTTWQRVCAEFKIDWRTLPDRRIAGTDA